MSIQLQSKLPDVGTTIFTVMSALSNECGAINLSQGFPNYDCDPVLKSSGKRNYNYGRSDTGNLYGNNGFGTAWR